MTRPRHALVIAQAAETRSLVERLLRAGHHEVRIVTVDELTSTLVAEATLVVVDDASLRDAPGASRAIRDHAGPAMRLALLYASGDRRGALDHLLAERADELIPVSSAEDTLPVTLAKLQSGDYFGLAKYLTADTETHAWTLDSSAEKAPVLDAVQGIASDVHCHPRIIDLVIGAVDEMIINALYRPDPDAETTGRSERPVAVTCGCDGRFFGVAVEDAYGLFRHADLFRAIGKALQHEERGIAADAPHASLGFRHMLGSLSHLVINVDPGRRTEIIGLVDLRLSLKTYRSAVPSLAMFTATTSTTA